MRFHHWILSLLSLGLAAVTRGAPQGPRVRTDTGVVEGTFDGTVRSFLGIPYAAPPVGDLRWRPPQPSARWEGVRAAKTFGPRPWQLPLYADMVFRDPGPSEDCLSLNVWTPPDAVRLPVMVWIYGGGLQTGGSSELRQDGSHLAARGVVVVSMNYRLGVFGFCTHPELIAESPEHAAGNYGLLDQLAALRWVRTNIAAFGGDPERVTIFGQSAGSMSVSTHMASPLARGLFQQAIGQSGGAFKLRGDLQLHPLDKQAPLDAVFLRARTGQAALAGLRATPAAQLQQAVADRPGKDTHEFTYVIDGYFLPRAIERIYAAGEQNDVPLLAGWTREEDGMTYGHFPVTADGLQAIARQEVPGREAEFSRWYGGRDDRAIARGHANFAGDRHIALGTWRWIEAQRAAGHAPIFTYEFDRAPPGDFFGVPHGAYHSADIVYVFHQFAAYPRTVWTPADEAVSNQIQSYWINFARTGNPNGAGLPHWSRYRADGGWPVMHLDAICRLQPDDSRGRMHFLEQAWRDNPHF